MPLLHRARWFNCRAKAIVGFYGPFLTPGVKVSEKLQSIRNDASRIVSNVHVKHNVSELLQNVSTAFDLDVERFFYTCIVKRLGHIFRHSESSLNMCV